MEGGRGTVYGLEYEDRFGAEGLVGVCIIEQCESVANIVNVLLSCRVLARGVEFRFLMMVLDDLRSAGVQRVAAEFIPSGKNAIAKDFYANCGMMRTRSGAWESDVSTLIEGLSGTRTFNADGQHVG